MEIYQYEPIIQDEHGFRIVRLFPGSEHDIHVEIIHASFDEIDLMEYDAVSYVWGSPELTSTIVVGGKKLNVTHNLELVLRDLRLPEDERYLWIDGICINQEKDKERNHQVRQMGTIYQRAELVLFHLGRSNDLTLVVQKIFEIYQEQHKLRPEMTFESIWVFIEPLLTVRDREFEAEICQGLRTILAAPWFRRVWIIQEVANARRALLHWGSASCPVGPFVKLVRYFGIETDSQQETILDMMPQRRRSKSPWSSQQDLYHLLKLFRRAEASQDHDRIFALLGMCFDGKGRGTMTTDYQKSESLVVREAIAYMFFCNEDDTDIGINTVGGLINGIESLLERVIIHLATKARLAGLRSLLSNRRDEISITYEILVSVLKDPGTEPEAVRILLAHRSDEVVIPAEVTRIVVGKGNSDIVPTRHGHHEKNLQFTFDWAESFEKSPGTFTPLWYAVHYDRVGQIGKLLKEGAGVDDLAPGGYSPLTWAAKTGNLEIVKILLKNHADVEAGFPKPLTMATHYGRLSIVELLIEYGANINCRDFRGRSPLSLAASGGFQAILSLGDSGNGARAMQNMIRNNVQASDLHLLQERLLEFWGATPSSEPLFSDRPSLHLKHAESPEDVGLYGLRKSTFDLLFGGSPRNDRDDRLGNQDEELGTQDIATYQIPGVYSEILAFLVQKGAELESQDLFGQTPLWWAVNYGHLPAVERLLQSDANVQVTGDFGITPLSWAIWNGHQDVAQKLLDGYDEIVGEEFDDSISSKASSPLFWAICKGSEFQVLQLLEKGLDITIQTPFQLAILERHFSIALHLRCRNDIVANRVGVPQLSLAILAGDEKLMNELLEEDTDIEVLYLGNTPLMLAAKQGNYTMVQRLLCGMANPNAQDASHTTPLVVAADCGFVSIVKVLIEYNADTNAALLEAAYYGYEKVAQLLLEHDADVEASDETGTPLMLASGRGHVATVRLLLGHGANVNARKPDGATALLMAARRGHWITVRLLLKHGAELEANIKFESPWPAEIFYREENENGMDERLLNFSTNGQHSWTALLAAAGHGYLRTARLLLKNGANIEAQNHLDATPLIWACRNGHVAVTRLLLEHNAKVRNTYTDRMTALMWLRSHRYTVNTEIEQILEGKLVSSHGASLNSEEPPRKKLRAMI